MAKAERSRAKDTRQGVVAQKERRPGGRKHRDKPWKVMHKSPLGIGKKWWVWARFATKSEAEAYIEKQQRSRYNVIPNWRSHFRIDGPDAVPDVQKKVA